MTHDEARQQASNIICEGLRPDVDDAYWGRCPECSETDPTNEYVNIERAHWMTCKLHRTRWFIGSNMFSGWRHETEATWRRNWERIGGYREISMHELLVSTANVSDAYIAELRTALCD